MQSQHIQEMLIKSATMLISPKPFQVQFTVTQQHLHHLCLGGRDARLSLKDQTSITAYHRGVFGVGEKEKAQGPTKARLWFRTGELCCRFGI